MAFVVWLHSLRSSSTRDRKARVTYRDQVQRVGGLDPASQLLAPLANQLPVTLSGVVMTLF